MIQLSRRVDLVTSMKLDIESIVNDEASENIYRPQGIVDVREDRVYIENIPEDKAKLKREGKEYLLDVR